MAPKIEKSEANVDWSWPAEKIHNLIRGLAAGPVAQTSRGGKIVKLHATRVAKPLGGGTPGQLSATGSGLHVVCGQGVLEILKIQPESSKAMSAADYLRGYPVGKGDAFGSTQSISCRA
jgi:methionyl-tRNA formyltransferase